MNQNISVNLQSSTFL